MQVLKVKTQEEFNKVIPPSGKALIWPQSDQDNIISLYTKSAHGKVAPIAGPLRAPLRETSGANLEVSRQYSSYVIETVGVGRIQVIGSELGNQAYDFIVIVNNVGPGNVSFSSNVKNASAMERGRNIWRLFYWNEVFYAQLLGFAEIDTPLPGSEGCHIYSPLAASAEDMTGRYNPSNIDGVQFSNNYAIFNEQSYLNYGHIELIGNRSRTYMMNFRLSTSSGTHTIFSQGVRDVDGGTFAIYLENRLVQFNGWARDERYTTPSNLFGAWRHLAVAYRGEDKQIQIYLDGDRIIDAHQELSTVESDFYLGQNVYDGGRKYRGWMSQFRAFDYALDEGEIRTYYNQDKV